MKKYLLFSCAIYSVISFAQSDNYDSLKNEVETIKHEINLLKSDINSIKSENIYLKKTLNINKAITEQKEDNNVYKIIKVIGNSKNKTVSIVFLVEAKDENKISNFSGLSIIDLEGNEYEMDYMKSSNTSPKLSVDVPMKIQITFAKIMGKPEYLKIFRFKSRNQPERNTFDSSQSSMEFRDLKINWN